MILFISLGMVEFSGYQGNPEMLEFLDSLPPALLEAFQMNAFNLTTVTGFFGVMFTYFALLSSVYAVMLGSDIISKEERDKTVEFSLTLPIPRRRIVTAKILAAVVNCIAFLLITWGISLVNVAQYKPDSEFYSVFLGCAMKQHKRASSVAVSLLLGTFFLSIISGLNENLDFFKYLSPFKYFDPLMLLNESRLDITFVWLSLGIIGVAIVGGYVSYARRDLYI
jgi:ABC-2 type transport system permease protein